mmetsp:Transcript_42024/g.134164  ORF Transcript_42024/g.134164 Transcript_42024/m.134164 type:complete len:293 (-) Transcript_42024:512-1390(-)
MGLTSALLSPIPWSSRSSLSRSPEISEPLSGDMRYSSCAAISENSGRRLGFFIQHSCIRSPSSSGMLGSGGGRMVPSRTPMRMSLDEYPTYTSRRANSSHITSAKAYTSDLVDGSSPASSSGAAYSRVPLKAGAPLEPGRYSGSMPKSDILRVKRSSRSMFEALRSRWMMGGLCRCRYIIPLAQSLSRFIFMRRSRSIDMLAMTSLSAPHGMYSVTRRGNPPLLPGLNESPMNMVTLGCLRAQSLSSSLMCRCCACRRKMPADIRCTRELRRTVLRMPLLFRFSPIDSRLPM